MSGKTKILTDLINLLDPLSPDERRRMVNSALTFIDGTHLPGQPIPAGAEAKTPSTDETMTDAHPKVKAWMQKNGITYDDLQQVFHIGDNDEVGLICAVPGKGMREQTLQVYLLTGLSNFIKNGDARFDDTQAREWSKEAGCYDAPNHTKSIKEKGNEFTGDKQKGWTLTAPGLKRVAGLVKEIANASDN